MDLCIAAGCLHGGFPEAGPGSELPVWAACAASRRIPMWKARAALGASGSALELGPSGKFGARICAELNN